MDPNNVDADPDNFDTNPNNFDADLDNFDTNPDNSVADMDLQIQHNVHESFLCKQD